MNNNEAKRVILEADSCFCKHGAYKDCHSGCKYREALDAAVKALEQEPTTKNELVVDCIDRNSIKYYPGQGGYMYASKGEIDKLPSVTPQEPFINKPCVSEKVCEHDKNVVLDKIRDQLKSNLRGVEITLEVLVENDPLRPKMEGAKTTLEDCLELIDKAETEDT